MRGQVCRCRPFTGCCEQVRPSSGFASRGRFLPMGKKGFIALLSPRRRGPVPLTSSRMACLALSGLPLISQPAARGWPPPPSRRAMLQALVSWPVRTLILKLPSFCWRRVRPTSTPSMERGRLVKSSSSAPATPAAWISVPGQADERTAVVVVKFQAFHCHPLGNDPRVGAALEQAFVELFPHRHRPR